MTTPQQLGFVLPTGQDFISGGDNAISTNATRSAAMYDALIAEIGAASFEKPAVGSTVDIRTLTETGGYPIRFAGNPNGTGFSGFLIVGNSENGTLTQVMHLMLTQGGGVMYEESRNGVWSDWEQLGNESLKLHPPIAGNLDMNTILDEGIYPVPGAANPNGLGVSGTLYANNPGNTSLDLVSHLFVATDGGGVHTQTARGGVFSGWGEVGAPKDAADKGAARHAILLSEARRRRGGKIGTAGRGVVSIRFDHHLDPFKQHILPLLKKYNLPWSQVMNSNSPFSDDTMPWSELQSTCINSGGEVWNHGGNHGDASSPNALRREIVTALKDLEANLPELAIEGWAPPGIAGGYGGITSMRTVETTDTLAGRMMLANHAFLSGYMGSHYRPLGGDPIIGHSHYTMDNAQVHHWANAVDKAAATGSAIAFMLHPSAIPDGQTTVAILDAAFANIAAKRDAGEIVVLSPSGSLIADAGSSFRRNLLGKSTFTAGESLTVVLDSAGGGYPIDFRGALHELTVGGSGTITVTSDFGGLNASYSSTEEKPQRLIFNVPLSATKLTITSSRAQTTAKMTAV